MDLLQVNKQFIELLRRLKTEPQRIVLMAQRPTRNYRDEKLLVPKIKGPRHHQEEGRVKLSSSGHCLLAEPAEAAQSPDPTPCCPPNAMKVHLTVALVRSRVLAARESGECDFFFFKLSSIKITCIHHILPVCSPGVGTKIACFLQLQNCCENSSGLDDVIFSLG